MYIEEMISIGRVENGYLIKVRVPEKEEKDYDGPCYHEPYSEKTFVEKDANVVAKKIAELLPKLQDKMEADEVFSQTFKEAVS